MDLENLLNAKQHLGRILNRGLFERERMEQITVIERQIQELEISVDDFEEISLIGVEVSFPKYGKGTVVNQVINKITVQFPEIEKEFMLDKSYTMRPRFENDDEVIEDIA